MKIQELYNLSCRKRILDQQFSKFIRDVEDFKNLCLNYSIRNSAVKVKLQKLCQAYRPVRGDGNCFYTAFGFQFLELLLLEYNNDEFEYFLLSIRQAKVPFKIAYNNFKIDDKDIEFYMREEFLLSQLRHLKHSQRSKALCEQFSAYEYVNDKIDGLFYGLAVIFFRNYCDIIIESSEMKDFVYDRENLLIWETECNSNESVIAGLAQYLKIQIQLHSKLLLHKIVN